MEHDCLTRLLAVDQTPLERSPVEGGLDELDEEASPLVRESVWPTPLELDALPWFLEPAAADSYSHWLQQPGLPLWR